MKLHVVSDLHLDHSKKADQEWLDNLKPQPDIDVLIVAGDWYSLYSPNKTKVLISRLLECYDKILMVPGNHDYFRSSPQEANELYESLNDGRVYIFTEPCYKMVKGQRFFGGTLWYRKPGPGKDKRFIDMYEIDTPEQWFFDQQKLFEDRLFAGADGSLEDTVVISHHVPTKKAMNPRFAGYPNNHFFITPMDKIIEELKPKVWSFGHTHEQFDFMLESTRMVCNARGYPAEHRIRPPYEPKLIEI